LTTSREAKAASSDFLLDRKGRAMASTRSNQRVRRAAPPAQAETPKAAFLALRRHGARINNPQGGSMKRWIAIVAALTGAALVALAAAALAAASGNATARAHVDVATSRLGQIVVDGKGITLYDFPPDKGTTSVCYGACAALWPPLVTHGKPVAGHGVRASLLGTTKRKDGTLQVTYGGHPLYYFVTDRKPGQTTGQGVNQFGGPWWVISAAGKEIHRHG
jgi:predicted lipoprotein with Yx(FWY)xxD motif